MDAVAKILFVEDDKRISDSTRKGLENEGFEVQAAFDGFVGARLATSYKFDLILLDVNLPMMNGFEVCKAIRQHGVNTPILMLTALGEIDDRVKLPNQRLRMIIWSNPLIFGNYWLEYMHCFDEPRLHTSLILKYCG